MSKIEFHQLDLEMECVSETEINKAIDCLKNGGTVEIVDKVSDMGEVNPPEHLEVIKTFNGQLSIEQFNDYVKKCKESGRRSFSVSKK